MLSRLRPLLVCSLLISLSANLHAASKSEAKSKKSTATENFLEYQYHSPLAKSKHALRAGTRLGLLDIEVIKPIDRVFGRNEDPIVELSLPIKHFGVGYLHHPGSDNYDSVFVDLLFFRLGRNFGGHQNGVSYYGRYDRNGRKPREYFFAVPEFSFTTSKIFKGKLALVASYDSSSVVLGCNAKLKKGLELKYRHHRNSDYLREIELNSQENLRNSLALKWSF